MKYYTDLSNVHAGVTGIGRRVGGRGGGGGAHQVCNVHRHPMEITYFDRRGVKVVMTASKQGLLLPKLRRSSNCSHHLHFQQLYKSPLSPELLQSFLVVALSRVS
ncbi:MAG: hypothetical protein JWR35_3799 [Marmoricola sp.]|nr:hypothetical protein [Marmoricola sp.]